MIVSVDVEVKERLENWRKWVRSAQIPGKLPTESIERGILFNNANLAANHYPSREMSNPEAEETDKLLKELLDDPDTYLGALAIILKYENHPSVPIRKFAEIFPTTYCWMNWRKDGGNFDDFRMAVQDAQKLKIQYPADYEIRVERNEIMEVGVSPYTFANTELEGRNFLVGMIKHARMPIKKVRSANVSSIHQVVQAHY